MDRRSSLGRRSLHVRGATRSDPHGPTREADAEHHPPAGPRARYALRPPDDLLFLLASYPRKRWPETELHETAERWLQIHDWFRQFSASLLTGTTDFREGRQSAPEFHRWLEPRLDTFLEFLEGHHHHEDSVYFPAFAKAEPRLEMAFAILDRDHDAIHERLAALEASGKEMREARLSADADRTRFAADRLAGTLEGLLGPLRRHLHDEEDIVIPLLLDRGDPVKGA